METNNEHDIMLRTLTPVVSGVARMFGSDCEVVLHDLRNPESSILCIANGHVSGRKLHGPIIGGPRGDIAFRQLLQHYEARSPQVYEMQAPDGRRLKSMTMIFHDSEGRPCVGLCINLDLTSISNASQFISQLLEIPDSTAVQDVGCEPVQNVETILQQVIEETLSEMNVAAEHMTKSDRLQFIAQLDARGIFLIKGAVQRVSKVLDVSKFSVYAYLEDIRNG